MIFGSGFDRSVGVTWMRSDRSTKTLHHFPTQELDEPASIIVEREINRLPASWSLGCSWIDTLCYLEQKPFSLFPRSGWRPGRAVTANCLATGAGLTPSHPKLKDVGNGTALGDLGTKAPNALIQQTAFAPT